jgi:CRISP-associated protein Cas1
MATDAPYIPLRPIQMKDRAGIIFLRYGALEVIDNAFVLIDKEGVRVQIPVGGLACIILEPGDRRLPAGLGRRSRCPLLRFGPAGRGARRQAAVPGPCRARRRRAHGRSPHARG